MGYPVDLDEYPEDRLYDEIARRADARKGGKCDYCGRKWSEPACRFPERHHKRTK